jgi:hypothetical protein
VPPSDEDQRPQPRPRRRPFAVIAIMPGSRTSLSHLVQGSHLPVRRSMLAGSAWPRTSASGAGCRSPTISRRPCSPPRRCRNGTPTATPTDTATAARPPRRSSTPAALTSRPPSNVSQELLSSKHKSSLAGIARTAASGQNRPRRARRGEPSGARNSPVAGLRGHRAESSICLSRACHHAPRARGLEHDPRDRCVAEALVRKSRTDS